MRAVFVTILSLLLSSGCLSGFEIDQNEDGNEAYRINRVPLNLIDLNDDVLYMILHHLNINELLNATEAMPELSYIIDDAFRRKYLKNEPLTKVNIARWVNKAPVKFGSNIIVIYELQDYINVMKYFGRFLPSVYIDYGMADNSDLKIINRVLNEYCSESLKQLQFWVRSGDNYLEQFTTPFKRLEEFSIYLTTHGLNASKPLNEVFPNLRRLFLNLDKDLDISSSDVHFSHLNHLKLSVTNSYVGTNRTVLIEQLKGVMTKNPTIRSIDFHFVYPPNFLASLSRALSNLEHLKIDLVTNDHHLDNIYNLRKLSLPNLQSLEMLCPSKDFDELLQFFKRHTKLRQIKFNRSFSCLFRNIPELNILIADLPNLVDLTIKSSDYYEIERIAKFIRNGAKLQKVHLEFSKVPKITTIEVTAVQEQFQNEWTVGVVEEIRLDGKDIIGFSFERKHPIQE